MIYIFYIDVARIEGITAKKNGISEGETDDVVVLHADVHQTTVFQTNKRSVGLLHN